MAVLHGLNLFYRVSCRPRRTKLPAERGWSEKSKRHAARQRSTRDIGGVSAIANALFFREHDVGGLRVEAVNRFLGGIRRRSFVGGQFHRAFSDELPGN